MLSSFYCKARCLHLHVRYFAQKLFGTFFLSDFLHLPGGFKILPFPAGNFHMLPSQKEMHGLRELEHVEKMKQDLLAKVKALGKELPLNTLDELINHFGGPEHVAEVILPSQEDISVALGDGKRDQQRELLLEEGFLSFLAICKSFWELTS